jgi:hypothetical protein
MFFEPNAALQHMSRCAQTKDSGCGKQRNT